jgi:aldose sugar dehydrogenase
MSRPEASTSRFATLVPFAAVLFVLAACSQNGASAPVATNAPESEAPAQTAAAPPCAPLETRAANAPEQRPTFAGQTRACAEPTNVAFDLTVVARGLANPWAVEPLPGGDLLVTEKPGRMRIVTPAGAIGEPIAGIPPVDARGQGGLLDVALSPRFATDRTIFWSFTEPRDGGNGTAVARGVLSADRRSVGDVRVIFRALPTYDGRLHYGSRITFAPDGNMLVTLGERSDASMRHHAQRLDSHLGTIVRIAPDGSVPSDNPFTGRSDARGEIWTWGHRNVQSAAFDAEGRFWIVEHGPRGGDELNLIERGKNYGWPLVTFGEEYSGRPVPDAVTTRERFEDPVYYWDPVIAPSGAVFHSGTGFPAWRGSLFVGGLSSKRLVRLSIRDGRVSGEEHLLTDRGQRIRDVGEGSDGSLWIVTDESNGELWRLAPRR